jgi:hypothetical protein
MSILPPVVRQANESRVPNLKAVGKARLKRRKSKGDKTMKFMMLVKHAENQGPPPKELMEAMAILSEEAVKDGTMRGNGGLAPTAQSTRVRVARGKLTVTDGPFTETTEIVGGFAQFEMNSRQDAIDGAVRFMELHRKYWPEWEGETEIRQIFGPEDFAQCVKERSEAVAQ